MGFCFRLCFGIRRSLSHFCGMILLEFCLQFLYLAILCLNLFALVLDSGEEGVELFVVHIDWIEGVDAVDEVAEDIHVVGECIVWSIVYTSVHAHAVLLGGHETEVV